MGVPIKRILLGVIVAVVASVLALWKTNVVNKLHFHQVSLKGKTALVTGSTEGIGKETAKVFAAWGADLILPVRNSKKGVALKEEILKEAAPGVKVRIYDGVDFADFQSVRDFAKKVSGDTIDILVNNAGMITPKVEASKDGMEVMFQVNHLSPFLLTHLLLPALQKSPAARVVFVSSAAHYTGSVGTFKYSEQQRGMQEYRPLMRYDDSKLMNVMTAITFSEQVGKDSKVTFASVHPGFVVSNLDNNLEKGTADFVMNLRHALGRQSREGAMAQVTVATHPKLEGVTGRYFSDGCMNELCNASCIYCDRSNAPGAYMNSEAYNKTSRDWLWNVSKKLTGV